MKKIIKIENNFDSDLLRIEWLVGNLCNRNCWYCFPGANTGDVKFPTDTELLKKNFAALFDRYTSVGKNKFDILLTGGEPTLWKDLPKVISYIKENYNSNIRVLTNGYRKKSWWEANKDIFDQIEISVHNEDSDIKHIIEIADYLFESNKMVVANVLMDPKNFDRCKDIVEELKSSKYSWPIITKTVFFDGVPNYTDEQKKYFDNSLRQRMPDAEAIEKIYKGNHSGNRYWVTYDNAEQFVLPNDRWIALEKLNHFYNWKCNLGVECLQITLDGRLTGNCLQKLYDDTQFYSILDKDFSLKFKPNIKSVICKQLTCTCTTDIHLTKEKLVSNDRVP